MSCVQYPAESGLPGTGAIVQSHAYGSPIRSGGCYQAGDEEICWVRRRQPSECGISPTAHHTPSKAVGGTCLPLATTDLGSNVAAESSSGSWREKLARPGKQLWLPHAVRSLKLMVRLDGAYTNKSTT